MVWYGIYFKIANVGSGCPISRARGSCYKRATIVHGTMDKDQTTTPGTTRPTLFDKCVGSLTSPANVNNEDAGDGAYGLSSLL